MPHIRQPSPGPTHVQSINYNLTPTNDSLPPPIHQSTLEAIGLISAQSISEMDTDQGDMIDETIKYVMHKLNKTILTPDTSITNSEMTPRTGNIKNKKPNVDDIGANTVADKPLKDSTIDFQLLKNVSLHPTNTDSNINATCIKVNHPQRKQHTCTYNI